MRTTQIVFGLALVLGAGAANAQSLAGSLGLVVYPSAGQTADQQRTDEQECHAWAQETTGVDPANPKALQTSAAPPEQANAGSAAAQGAVRGMARGALIGNLSDNDWEEWAAAGAISGSVRGAQNAQRRNAHAQQQATQQQQAAAAEEVELFKKAFSACVEGRSYTIK